MNEWILILTPLIILACVGLANLPYGKIKLSRYDSLISTDHRECQVMAQIKCPTCGEYTWCLDGAVLPFSHRYKYCTSQKNTKVIDK